MLFPDPIDPRPPRPGTAVPPQTFRPLGKKSAALNLYNATRLYRSVLDEVGNYAFAKGSNAAARGDLAGYSEWLEVNNRMNELRGTMAARFSGIVFTQKKKTMRGIWKSGSTGKTDKMRIRVPHL